MFFKKQKQIRKDIIELQNDRILKLYPDKYNLNLKRIDLIDCEILGKAVLYKVYLNKRSRDYLQKLNVFKQNIESTVIFEKYCVTKKDKEEFEKRFKEFEKSFNALLLNVNH